MLAGMALGFGLFSLAYQARLSNLINHHASAFAPIKCAQCSKIIGKVYKTTSFELDHLRGAFTFSTTHTQRLATTFTPPAHWWSIRVTEVLNTNQLSLICYHT
jgi:hypothetical protein